MSLLEKLCKEIEEKPELGKKLLEKLAEIEPRLSLAFQIERLISEIKLLAEGLNKLREDFNREMVDVRKEIVSLREEQNKLREDFNREMAALREEQNKLREEHNKLREDFNRMMKVIEGLQKGYRDLERRLERSFVSLNETMIRGFGELSKFAGMSFEQFVRVFLSARLRAAKELPPEGELRRETVDGEEIDLFFEDPLVVGEATAHISSLDELDKLERKAKVAATKFGRKPMKFLIALTASKEIAQELRRLARERGIELIIGRET